MDTNLQICVVIPVYNHPARLAAVLDGARSRFPVIVVDDGSTDDTDDVLARQTGVTVMTLPRNMGKGAALRKGFERARVLGYTHAITMDADGQHSADDLPALAAACRAHSESLIVGVRDFAGAGAPRARRTANAISNFWFRFETGLSFTDTQCGFRGYPLQAVDALVVKAGRYAYELEILVRAAWAGMELRPLPVQVEYTPESSQLSHFRPVMDFVHTGHVHASLSFQAFCLPKPARRMLALGELRGLPWRRRMRVILGHVFAEHTNTPARVAGSIGLGLFCGVAPIWGYQTVAAALLAHKFRLNKAIAVAASNISFPLACPFIVMGSLTLGHVLITGERLAFTRGETLARTPLYLVAWLLGSIVLALLTAVLGGLLAFAVVSVVWKKRAGRG